MLDPLLISYLCLGLISGLLGGMLGIGGGVIIVPALIFLFESSGQHASQQITLIAVATSMSCIVFTSASAAYTQYRADKVLWPIFKRMAPLFVLGSFCAGLLTPWVDASALRAIIGLFLLLVGVVMLADWKPQPGRKLPGLPASTGIGFLGGMTAGTAGIAGGNVIVPTLIYFNVPTHNATATSSAMGVPIALFGALSYALGFQQPGDNAASGTWMIGYIDLEPWLWITIAAIITAPVGVRIAHRLPAKVLKQAFGGLLLLVAARMVYGAYQLS
ncbi:MAG: putative membrane protein YfcA [Limisphaerales bacterium]|jgi:uncharacterized membrane protein YfcA